MNRPNLSIPKRHHYVPVCYLKAWADETDRVAVRRRGAPRPFATSTGNIGSENRLYGQGEVARAREEMFRRLEDDWPRLKDKLVISGGLRGEERDAAALFAALQFVRTPQSLARRNFVASVAEFTSERPVSKDSVRRFLAEEYLGFAPEDAEVECAWILVTHAMDTGDLPTSDETFTMAMDVALKEIAPRLGQLRWTVETCRKPILFTSDRPVMCWRPKSYRDRFEGLGLDNADEIRMPLDPRSLLILRRSVHGVTPVRVEPKRFAQVNVDIAAQCFEFVSTRRHRIGDLHSLQMADRLPTLRFNMAPGWRAMPGGRDEPMGDILHMWTPAREA